LILNQSRNKIGHGIIIVDRTMILKIGFCESTESTPRQPEIRIRSRAGEKKQSFCAIKKFIGGSCRLFRSSSRWRLIAAISSGAQRALETPDGSHGGGGARRMIEDMRQAASSRGQPQGSLPGARCCGAIALPKRNQFCYAFQTE
jgi:hypothetical protein